jgi:hypothetical protein
MAVLDEVRAEFRTNPGTMERLIVAVFVAGVALVLGRQAHGRLAPLRLQEARLASVAANVRQFRSSYRAPTPQEEKLFATRPDTTTLGIQRDSRLALAQRIATEAEGAGLKDVRVKFAGTDSAFVPPRTILGSPDLPVANYTISLDCTGSFADLLMFVSRLPVAVSVSRLRSQRLESAGGSAAGGYSLILAVYEATNGKHPG